MELSAVVGWIATCLGVSFAWPQAFHAVRSPSLAGVSGLTQVLMLVTSLSWTAYGFALDDTIIVVANTMAGLAVAVTVVALVQRNVIAPLMPLGSIAAWGIVLFVGFEAVGPSAPGLLGAGLGMAMTLPQAVFIRRGGPPIGVSATTYGLLAATMSAWLVYGLLTSDPVVVAPNVVAGPVVLSVWRAARHRPDSLDDVAGAELIA